MKLKTPIIIVNFKTYKDATGKNAFELAILCNKLVKKTKSNIAVCPQAVDLHAITNYTDLLVFAQHMDLVEYGSNTGSILPESIKAVNATGTLLNHSEHRLPFKVIKATVKRAKELKLTTIICAKSAAEVKKLAVLKPDFIAYEPPKLIGGKISVADAKPKIVKDALNAVKKKCKLLIGAGVHNEHDVRVSLELGASGVLLASGVIKAKNKKRVLLNLIKGLK